MAEPGTSPDDVVVIIGTRPEAIKLAGIVRCLGSRARVVHTGQHYDASLWGGVIEDLESLRVDAGLSVGGRTRGEQIGAAITELTRYLATNPARAVTVQGDTNSTLAGSIAASTLGIPVVHVEAGLRSRDRRMPEEINRLVVDAVADLCCAPIATNAEQLRSEGVAEDRILITGNTLGDALTLLLPDEAEQLATLQAYQLTNEGYVLSTVHRADTTGDPQRLGAALSAIARLADRVPVVLPLHPRTAAAAKRWKLLNLLDGVRVIDPLPPREFLALEARSGLLISDSGGVQEEACLLRRPLVVLRDSTERPELLDGWCRLVGSEDPSAVIERAWCDQPDWLAALRTRPLPYAGAGGSQLIVEEIDKRWPAPA